MLAAGRTASFDVPELRRAAREYAERNTTSVATLVRIEFPSDAKPVADELRGTVIGEVADLDLLAGVSARDDAYPLLNRIYWAIADELAKVDPPQSRPPTC